MIIFCDYCEKQFEIKADELDDWITLDPSDGTEVVMCPSCESRPTPVAPDAAMALCPHGNRVSWCAECEDLCASAAPVN